MADSYSFGAWVRRRRRALDLTQDALALRVGCSKDLIVRIEGDARRPSRQVAELLAAHLQLAPEERGDFIRAARAELAADRLPPPTQSVPRPALVPAGSAPAAPIGNLPAELSSFLGREREIAELTTLFGAPHRRLVTLTGAGGSGKTRLALRVAAALSPAYTDGVWFVDLAPISDPHLAAPTIANTLGLASMAQRNPQQNLEQWLRSKQALLVLDNFEQILEAGELVRALLQAAPQLAVLITSRIPLRLRGEQEYLVAPLALPPTNVRAIERSSESSVDTELRQYAAIQLFIERALSVKPGFCMKAVNAPVVVEICARLDGLPLAIELAAARMRAFTPEALLGRLQHAIVPILTGGARDLPARQQTIRATIEWSYRLLSPPQQQLFARLGVFTGGWTLPAAEAVVHTATLNVLEELQILIEHNLVQVAATDDEPRYTMLETLREFALEQLHEGDRAQLRHAHATYYVALAEQGEPLLKSRYAALWHARLKREFGNIRSVFRWSLEHPDQHVSGLRLIAALGDVYFPLSGHLDEIIGWLAASLPIEDRNTPPILRARVFYVAGAVARHTNRREQALVYYQKSLKLFQEHAYWEGAAWVLNHLGYMAEVTFERERLQRESLKCAEAAHDLWGIGWARLGLGVAAQGNREFAAADQHFQVSLSCFQQLEISWNIMYLGYHVALFEMDRGDLTVARRKFEQNALLWQAEDSTSIYLVKIYWHLTTIALIEQRMHDAQLLAQRATKLAVSYPSKRWYIASLRLESRVAYEQGDVDRAYEHAQRSLLAAQQHGEDEEAAFALRAHALLALKRMDTASALAFLEQALTMFNHQGNIFGSALTLDTIALSMAVQEHYESACRVWGAAATLRTHIHQHMWHQDIFESAHQQGGVREALGDAAFDAAWTAGQALTLEQAVAEALALTAGSARPGAASR